MHIQTILQITTSIFSVSVLAHSPTTYKLLQSNDDGWAVAQVRAFNTALNAAGFHPILSCPAVNKSGKGSSTTTPTALKTPCEFNTCRVGSPAEGFNASNTRLNYVNGYPVDATLYGIKTLAPKFFNKSKPDLVLAGPNVGNNAGSTVLISGTVGAASAAALNGIPSIAFSGASGSQVSYTTLQTDPKNHSSLAAFTYAALSVKFLDAFLSSGTTPLLPPGISLNVNYPSITPCPSTSNFTFVLSRINANASAVDVQTCGTRHLPTESSVLKHSGCFSSVSVFNASTKGDVDAKTQGLVLKKLTGLLTCLPA